MQVIRLPNASLNLCLLRFNFKRNGFIQFATFQRCVTQERPMPVGVINPVTLLVEIRRGRKFSTLITRNITSGRELLCSVLLMQIGLIKKGCDPFILSPVFLYDPINDFSENTLV